MDFFGRLREERARLGLTQQEVADTANVHVKTVRRWESQVPIPLDAMVPLLAIGYDVQYVASGLRSKNVHELREKGVDYEVAPGYTRDEVEMLKAYRALMPAQRDEMQREDADDPAAFPSFAGGLGVPFAAWTVARAPIAPTLRQLGGWHDLVVLERDMVPPERTLDVLGEALLGCRVPCLLLPPGWNGTAAFQRVAIGWNGSAEATGALRRALPILQLARRVTLIDGEMRGSGEDAPGVARPDPVVYLRQHQVEAVSQRLPAPAKAVGAQLLHKARELQADLLVMGAYSQSRTRERVFGGATRHVLLHADIPLLMQH